MKQNQKKNFENGNSRRKECIFNNKRTFEYKQTSRAMDFLVSILIKWSIDLFSILNAVPQVDGALFVKNLCVFNSIRGRIWKNVFLITLLMRGAISANRSRLAHTVDVWIYDEKNTISMLSRCDWEACCVCCYESHTSPANVIADHVCRERRELCWRVCKSRFRRNIKSPP